MRSAAFRAEDFASLGSDFTKGAVSQVHGVVGHGSQFGSQTNQTGSPLAPIGLYSESAGGNQGFKLYFVFLLASIGALKYLPILFWGFLLITIV